MSTEIHGSPIQTPAFPGGAAAKVATNGQVSQWFGVGGDDGPACGRPDGWVPGAPQEVLRRGLLRPEVPRSQDCVLHAYGR